MLCDLPTGKDKATGILRQIKKMVKKLALLVLLLTKISLGQSQYIDSTSQWHEQAIVTSLASPDTIFYQDYVYYLSGDSVVTSYSYLQLFRTGIDSAVGTQNSGYSISTINERIGLLREDTTTKRVYFIPNSQTFEFTLYDFSLSLGATLPYSFGFPNCSPGNIFSVDTFYFGGQVRERWFVAASSNIGAVRIFEGIGANCGLLGMMCISSDGISSCLKRFYNSTDTLQFINCSTVISINEDQSVSMNIVDVCPNPFLDKLNYTVVKENFREMSYSVLSILGKTVLEMQVCVNQNGIIVLTTLPSGMYFLIITVDGEQIIKKILKE